MAFFDPQGALLAGDNAFLGAERVWLRIRPAGVVVMSCVDEFYAVAGKNIFLTEKAVKHFFTYFFNNEGASSYNPITIGFNSGVMLKVFLSNFFGVMILIFHSVH